MVDIEKEIQYLSSEISRMEDIRVEAFEAFEKTAKDDIEKVKNRLEKEKKDFGAFIETRKNDFKQEITKLKKLE